MATRRQLIEASLAAWREAERRLDAGAVGNTESLQAEVARHRDAFQRLSTEHMIERLDALKDAEARRASSVPSTEPFHDAAKDEERVAAEIWEHVRANDEDIPVSEEHRTGDRERPPGRGRFGASVDRLGAGAHHGQETIAVDFGVRVELEQ